MKSLIIQLFKIINIITYIIIIALWIIIPEETALNLSLTAFNISLSSLLILAKWNECKVFIKSSYCKRLINSIITTILIFFILTLINFLAFKNPKQYDLSQLKQNTLTEQSKKIIKNIDGKIVFKVFSSKTQLKEIYNLLELYRLIRGNIEIEFIDIQINPVIVNKYNINKENTVVVEYKDRKEYVLELTEINITNALSRITRENNYNICYTIGHGEHELDNKTENGSSFLKDFIIQSSYNLITINLNEEKEIRNCHALMIWGPRQGFFENEIKLIKKYLKSGGSLLVGLDANLNRDNFKNIRNILKNTGIIIENNLVIDRVKHVSGSSGTVPIINNFDQSHDITKNFNQIVFFPLVSSVKPAKSKQGKFFTILGKTSEFPASWAEESANEFVKGKVTYNKEVDEKGPIGLFGAWSKKASKTKIVAFGNSTFVTNNYTRFTNNFKVLINSISWLVNEDRLISFNLPTLKDEPVFISSAQLGLIFYICIILMPLLVFIIAFLFYKRRRKL